MRRIKLWVSDWSEHGKGHIFELVISTCASESDWPPYSLQVLLAVPILYCITLFNQKVLLAEVVHKDLILDLKHLILAVFKVEVNRLFLDRKLWYGGSEEKLSWLLRLIAPSLTRSINHSVC